MSNPYRDNSVQAPGDYDPRWFIWTIVFLVVVGISLTSYIMLSDPGANEIPQLSKHLTKNK